MKYLIFIVPYHGVLYLVTPYDEVVYLRGPKHWANLTWIHHDSAGQGFTALEYSGSLRTRPFIFWLLAFGEHTKLSLRSYFVPLRHFHRSSYCFIESSSINDFIVTPPFPSPALPSTTRTCLANHFCSVNLVRHQHRCQSFVARPYGDRRQEAGPTSVGPCRRGNRHRSPEGSDTKLPCQLPPYLT